MLKQEQRERPLRREVGGARAEGDPVLGQEDPPGADFLCGPHLKVNETGYMDWAARILIRTG